MRRVVVTGLGAITPLGVGIRPTWTRLIAGESGIVSVADREPRARWAELPSRVAGVVSSEWRASDWLTASDTRRMSLFTQYAVAASDMALRDAGLSSSSSSASESDSSGSSESDSSGSSESDSSGSSESDSSGSSESDSSGSSESSPMSSRTGVCLGSGIGNLVDMYDTSISHHSHGHRAVSPLFVPRLLINMAAGHIAMRHNLQGPNHAATTACTTGAHSIGDAARFITYGDADVMLAGGAEACLHPLAFAGFARAKSLATAHNDQPGESCRPFDALRSGFVMAEGAAVCVLEELEHAKTRGARIYAEVAGYGCSGDAHHMTAPREDGAGAHLAMTRALAAAGLTPARVGYINAHATGTRVGDVAEARAIHRLMLGHEGVRGESDVVVSSTKGALGHLLGASGAIEALLAVLAIHEGVVPPTLNLHRPDVGFDFNFVPLEAQQRIVDVALTNSFGFGGTNSTLVFARME